MEKTVGASKNKLTFSLLVSIFSTALFALLANTCHSAEPMLNINDKNLKKCAECAREIADLKNLEHKINKSKIDSEKLTKINKISKELQEYVEATCPHIGFECKTFLSRPEKNNCKPFRIQNNDRFVLQNDTYR